MSTPRHAHERGGTKEARVHTPARARTRRCQGGSCPRPDTSLAEVQGDPCPRPGTWFTEVPRTLPHATETLKTGVEAKWCRIRKPQ